MAITTTGLEWNRFYNDDKNWSAGQIHEDEQVFVDGVLFDETHSLDDLPELAVVRVVDGVFKGADGVDLGSLEGVFRRWRKAQLTMTVLVELPRDQVDALKIALRGIKGARISAL
jgi:hypothetical protein